MSGASEKARFYLERYVPELQEYARKDIFTRDQIAAITAKRSDFEHILNARGSTPGDYARYATYEMNLDSLRKKRCKRLGVKSTTFSGQRTVFFILDRATKKFPGDIRLWMQYIEFCRREKANKKLVKVFTQVLRLRPREYGLWVLAAKYYAEEQGDMSTARSYMQRGLRFCGDKAELYLEYVKLEMVYLAKLAARRKILGLDEETKPTEDAEDEDMIALPSTAAEDISPVDPHNALEDVNAEALRKVALTPAFTGAIPIAIFDAAMQEFKQSCTIAEKYFDVVASFDSVPSSWTVLQHIVSTLHAESPNSVEALFCQCRLDLFNIDPPSSQFPSSLRTVIKSVDSTLSTSSAEDKSELAERALLLLLPFMQLHTDLDEAIVKVLRLKINDYLHKLPPGTSMGNARVLRSETVKRLIETYSSQGNLSTEALAGLAKELPSRH